MVGFFDKQPWPSSPIVGSMSSPRILPRRTMLLVLVAFAFMGVLMLSARNADQLCEDGSYCDISGWRSKLGPKFGGSAVAIGDETSINSKEYASKESSKESNSKDKAGRPIVQSSREQDCVNFPNTSSVLTIMKTGASEAYSKIPTQLLTTLKCVPDFLLFSDMAQKIAGYTIYDSLDTVLSEVKDTNSDFELYHRQKKCPVDQEACNKDQDVASKGWDLDKYKNIHMAEKAYRMRPNHDWYLFVDADTYVAYPTLMEWLKTLKPSKPHYIGSVAYLGGLPFAHGGSGYLVSQAAMHAMFFGKINLANKFDEPVQHTCCGDAMWSQALKDETGIEVVNAWPVINGEKPHTLPYAEDEWCQPIVTMHHAAAQDISDLHAYERERKFSKPLRIKDLFYKFMEPRLTESRSDWDNFSDDTFYLDTTAEHEDWVLDRAKKEDLSEDEAVAHESFDNCKKACSNQDNCFQFRYSNRICGISHKIKHGKPVKKGDDDSKRFMSGWDVEKIKSWVKDQGSCKKSFKWPVTDAKIRKKSH